MPNCQITARLQQKTVANVLRQQREYNHSTSTVNAKVIAKKLPIADIPSIRSPTIFAKPTIRILMSSELYLSRTDSSSRCASFA